MHADRPHLVPPPTCVAPARGNAVGARGNAIGADENDSSVADSTVDTRMKILKRKAANCAFEGGAAVFFECTAVCTCSPHALSCTLVHTLCPHAQSTAPHALSCTWLSSRRRFAAELGSEFPRPPAPPQTSSSLPTIQARPAHVYHLTARKNPPTVHDSRHGPQRQPTGTALKQPGGAP